MREIKFRAWDGSKYFRFDNHKYDLIFNDISGWNIAPNIAGYKGEWTAGESQNKTPNFILEQFTGLCDKKGTEIYEGDQIGQWCEVDGMRIQSCLQVFWNEFTASYHVDNSYSQDKSFSEELWQALEGGDYEVVGNIYQKN